MDPQVAIANFQKALQEEMQADWEKSHTLWRAMNCIGIGEKEVDALRDQCHEKLDRMIAELESAC